MSQPLGGDLLEHGMHQDPALRGLDRQDRRGIRLVADTQYVLTEVREATRCLALDRGDRPLFAGRSQDRVGPDDPVELCRLRVEPSAQRIGSATETRRREMRVGRSGESFGCRQYGAPEQSVGVRLVVLDRHAEQ